MKLYKLGVGCALAAAAFRYGVAQTQIDLRTQTKSVDFSNAGSTKPSKTGTVLPATCTVGETFLKTNATAGQNWYVCTASNVWSAQGGGSLPVYLPGSYGKILSNDDAGMSWEALSGDVSGAPDALVVGKLQGRDVSPTAPGSGQFLSWTGSQWAPQAPTAAQVTNAVDRSAANTYSSGARQTFVAGAGAPGLRVSPGALPGSPQAGDLAVDSGDANRAKLFDGTSWVSMATVPNYFSAFTAVTTVTVPGTTHRLGTANLVVECYDNASPANRVEPDSIRINPATYDVSVTFAVPQTGRLVINAAGGGGSNGVEATASLDFPGIATGSCAAEQTLSLQGALPGDEVAPGWPSTLEAGLIGMMRVTAANTVAVRLCNFSGVLLDPAGATFRARIARNF